MCKSISEKLVMATADRSKIGYVVTRYGNVLSSKGSIVPLFLKQAKESEAFTVTDPNMTRFMMLLEDSVMLIDMALGFGSSGSLWIPKLDSFRVEDLANFFSKKFNKPIKIIGIRPGEKIHEVMMNETEDLKKQDFTHAYCVKDTPFSNSATPSFKEYSSKDVVVSYEELESRLNQFLEKETYVKTVR
jgi:UDP-glucose 4-epimerase